MTKKILRISIEFLFWWFSLFVFCLWGYHNMERTVYSMIGQLAIVAFGVTTLNQLLQLILRAIK